VGVNRVRKTTTIGKDRLQAEGSGQGLLVRATRSVAAASNTFTAGATGPAIPVMSNRLPDAAGLVLRSIDAPGAENLDSWLVDTPTPVRTKRNWDAELKKWSRVRAQRSIHEAPHDVHPRCLTPRSAQNCADHRAFRNTRSVTVW